MRDKVKRQGSKYIQNKIIRTTFTTLIHTQKQKLIHKFHAYSHINKHHSHQDNIKLHVKRQIDIHV